MYIVLEIFFQFCRLYADMQLDTKIQNPKFFHLQSRIYWINLSLKLIAVR